MTGLRMNFRLGWLALVPLSLLLALANGLGSAAAQNSAAPFWAPSEAEIAASKNCLDAAANALERMEKNESSSFSCGTTTSAKVEGYFPAILYFSSYPYNTINEKKYAAIIPNNEEYHVLNFTLEWSWYGRNLPSDIIPPVDLDKFAEGLSGAKRFPNQTYWYDRRDWPAPVPAANNLCPAVVNAIDTIYSASANKRLPKGAFVTECVLANGPHLQNSHRKIMIIATVIVPRSKSAGTPVKTSACTTDLLKGPWRAEPPALAKTGHAVTFAVATGGTSNHDGNQKRYRGEFTTYPAHKRLLGLVPTPMFTHDKAYAVGKDLCLIPMVIAMRDSGVSRSAALIDSKNGSVRFINERAYFFKNGSYQIYADQLDAQAVSGAPGRWLRGAAAAQAPSCKPADFNGRWDRSDGAKITIRGTGTDGVGGYASMDENPGNWVRGQNKYVSMRMKEACVYTAKCFASQRTVVNGRPDFKMVETACELVLDPVKQTLRERGTSNTYVYTRAGAGPSAAASKPQSPPAEAVRTPEPALPSAAVQSLNAQQAAAAQREIAAYEAQKKAIADRQAAREAAYRQSLADQRARDADYAAKVADYNARVAAAERKAAEDMAKWRAAVAACKAGDRSQCAPKPK